MCLTVFKKPPKEITAQFEKYIGQWNEKNVKDTDIQYIHEVQTKIAFEKERLLKLKLNFAEKVMSSEEKLDEISRTEEMIAIYEEMMIPIKDLTVNVENLYLPICIGVISHWPWYDILKDWLCRLNQVLENQQEINEITTSIER